MKKIGLFICMLLLSATCALSQTTVTATVVDSDSVAWARGTVTAVYFHNGSNTIVPNVTATLNSSGVLSMSLTSPAFTWYNSPNPSGWVFTVCPAVTGAKCGTTQPLTISGSSQSISTQLNAVITAPRLAGGAGINAYADVEVTAATGTTYYNLISLAQRCYTTGWTNCQAGSVVNAVTSAVGGTGTGTITCVTGTCTNMSGGYSIAGGTFTTGNLLVLTWPTTGTAYKCTAVQNTGNTHYAIGHSVATATGMTITNGVTVAGATFVVDYSCSQF